MWVVDTGSGKDLEGRDGHVRKQGREQQWQWGHNTLRGLCATSSAVAVRVEVQVMCTTHSISTQLATPSTAMLPTQVWDKGCAAAVLTLPESSLKHSGALRGGSHKGMGGGLAAVEGGNAVCGERNRRDELAVRGEPSGCKGSRGEG